MAIGDLYRLTIESHYTATSTQVNNVLHFLENVDHAGHGAVDLGADWAAHVGASSVLAHAGYKNYISTNYSLDNIRVQRLAPTLDAPVSGVYTPPFTGNFSSASAPAIAAMVLRLRGTLPGRSGAGRLYLGGFTTNAILDDGRWHPTPVAQVNAAWTLVLGRYSGSFDWLWVVYSPKIGGRAPYNAIGATPMLTVAADPVIRLERSREFGVARRHAGHH